MTFKRGLYDTHCSSHVPELDQSYIRNLKPLWHGLLDLKLGHQSDLIVYSIMVIFETQGVCAFYQDPAVQSERLAALNALSKSAFTHEVFDLPEVAQPSSLNKKQKLFGEEKETFVLWALIRDTPSGHKIAIGIQYDLSDLKKMMPSFVDKLEVPLIAISDTKTHSDIYFKDHT